MRTFPYPPPVPPFPVNTHILVAVCADGHPACSTGRATIQVFWVPWSLLVSCMCSLQMARASRAGVTFANPEVTRRESLPYIQTTEPLPGMGSINNINNLHVWLTVPPPWGVTMFF